VVVWVARCVAEGLEFKTWSVIYNHVLVTIAIMARVHAHSQGKCLNMLSRDVSKCSSDKTLENE
jgi:hypothetical protein